jgi:TatD DNase family protein
LGAPLVDIGSNLTHESFAADRREVIDRAIAAGVTRQIVTGADLDSSRAAAALAIANPEHLWSTAGVPPHHARAFSPPASQRTAFVAQLELAARIGKPVFLHQRDAHADFLAIVKEFRTALSAGVAHCFTGTTAELEAYLDLDLYIGVTGWVCDERRGGALREAVPHIPTDRLMLETDAPYLLPRDLQPRPRSRRNEPGYLPHVARTVAGLRGDPDEMLAASTTRNAVAFFRLGSGRESAG